MGALDGLRVIDFGQWIAGPLAAMLLADQGAEVIRVDPRDGPRWDTPANAVWNRGKQRIALDLKQSADRRTAEELIASADVVIENFRPGVMDRLGLGAEQMTARDDQLIYLSLPGFGATDERRDIAAWEGVVSAGVGTYSTRLMGGETPQPVYTAVPIASVYGAFVGAAATAMALVARERDGLGQRIESPLHDSLYQAVGLRGLRYHNVEPAQRFVPWVGAYECADGRWIFFHAAFSHFVRQFCEAAGVPEWLDEPWSNGPRVATDAELAGEARRRLTEIFKTRPALEWEELINAAGPPTVRCLDSHEWLEEEHARASEAVVQLDDPALGPMLQPGVQVRMSGTPGAVGHAQRAPDADREAVLTGLAEAAPPAPWAGAPRLSRALEGIRALDLCIILAGPTCGRTLAEYGADVIKIDNPNREGDVMFHEDVNRGKRSLFLDLKSDDGRNTFRELVDSADVVVQNYRLGAMRRLGIDYESLAIRKPGVGLRDAQCVRRDRALGGARGLGAAGAGGDGDADALRRRRSADTPAVRDQRLRHRDHGGVRRRDGAVPPRAHWRGAGNLYRAGAHRRHAAIGVSARLRGQALGRAARPKRAGRRPAPAAVRGRRRLALPGRSRRSDRGARRDARAVGRRGIR